MANDETTHVITIESNANKVEGEVNQLVGTLKELAAALNTTTQSTNQTAQAQERQATSTSKVNTQNRELAQGFRSVAAISREVLIPISLLGAEIGPLGEGLTRTASAMTTMGTSAYTAATIGLTPLFAIATVAVGAIVGVGLAVTALAAQFSDAMPNIGNQTRMTTEELTHMGDVVKSIAADTAQDAIKLAQSYEKVIGQLEFYNRGLALSVEQQELYLKTAAALARTTGDQEGAFAALTKTLIAFKMPMESLPELGDKLQNVWRSTGIGLEELGNAMARVAAKGGPMAQNMDTVLTLLLAASQAGLQGAQAMRVVNSVFDDMIAPTEKLKDQLGKLGIDMDKFASADALGRIQMLGQRWNELGDAQTIAAEASLLFGSNGGAAASVALSLHTNGELINDTLREQGTLMAAQASEMEEFNNKWGALVQMLKNFGISIGTSVIPGLIAAGENFSVFGTRVQEILSLLPGYGKAAGTGTATAVAEGLKDETPAVEAATEEMVDKVVEGIAEGEEKVEAGGKALATTFISAVETKHPELKTAGISAADVFWGGFFGNLSDMAQKYTDLVYGTRERATAILQGRNGIAPPTTSPTDPVIDNEELADAIDHVAESTANVVDQEAVRIRQAEASRDATAKAILAQHQLAENRARFGAAAEAAATSEVFFNKVRQDGLDTTASYEKEMNAAVAAVDNLGVAAEARGVPGARALATQLKELLVIIKTPGMAPDEGLIGRAQALIEQLGNTVPLKSPGADRTPAKTTIQGFREGWSEARPEMEELAGEIAADAIGALNRAWEERAESIRRTGEDAASGAGKSAANAAQKAIAKAREVGVEEWRQYEAEVLPVMQRALTGDLGALQEFQTLMTELGQKIIAQEAANKWAKQWTDAEMRVAAKSREFADQRIMQEEKVGDQIADEAERHASNMLTIAGKAAERRVEQEIKTSQAVTEAHIKSARDRENAEEDHLRRLSDLKEKEHTDELRRLESEKLAQTQMLNSKADKEADVHLKSARDREDLMLKVRRAEEDLDERTDLTREQKKAKEDEMKKQTLRSLQDIKREENRAMADSATDFARKKRDETQKLAMEANVRKINHDAELKSADTIRERKLTDIDTEEQKAIESIARRDANQKALDEAKRLTQSQYFQTEEQRETARHTLAMAHIERENAQREAGQNRNLERQITDTVEQLRRQHQDIYKNNDFDEDQVRNQLYQMYGASPTGSDLTPEDIFPSKKGNTNQKTSGKEFGGNFRVGGRSNGADSSLVSFYATPGETVSVGGGQGQGQGMSSTDLRRAISEAITDQVSFIAREFAGHSHPIHMDGKKVADTVTKNQYKRIETRATVGGRY